MDTPGVLFWLWEVKKGVTPFSVPVQLLACRDMIRAGENPLMAHPFFLRISFFSHYIMDITIRIVAQMKEN